MSHIHPSIAIVDWSISTDPVPYLDAVRLMEHRAAAIAAGEARELVWLLEHPPIYTAGTSARSTDLMQPARLPVHETGRGGQYTYHGPGQRVVYVMLDVRTRFGSDVRAYVTALEDWIIDTLAILRVQSGRRLGKTGVWVKHIEAGGASDAKIAAIGVRISRGVSLHGVSINVAPDLDHYAGIVPCGIRDAGVTSLAGLGVSATLNDVDNGLAQVFERRFAPVNHAARPDSGAPKGQRPAPRARSRASI